MLLRGALQIGGDYHDNLWGFPLEGKVQKKLLPLYIEIKNKNLLFYLCCAVLKINVKVEKTFPLQIDLKVITSGFSHQSISNSRNLS